MEFQPIKPDLVRYEMRMVQGTNPHAQEQKRPGAFARFLSGTGKILGSVAMPLSFIFPPAAIGAAGMYGAGAIGDQMQQRIATQQMEQMQRQQQTTVSFPGLGVGGQSGLQPASGTVEAYDQDVMNVLFHSNEAMIENAHSF